MISAGRLEPDDRAPWEALFRAYIDFYERTEPQEMYDRAWRELQARRGAFRRRSPTTQVHHVPDRPGTALTSTT